MDSNANDNDLSTSGIGNSFSSSSETTVSSLVIDIAIVCTTGRKELTSESNCFPTSNSEAWECLAASPSFSSRMLVSVQMLDMDIGADTGNVHSLSVLSLASGFATVWLEMELKWESKPTSNCGSCDPSPSFSFSSWLILLRPSLVMGLLLTGESDSIWVPLLAVGFSIVCTTGRKELTS